MRFSWLENAYWRSLLAENYDWQSRLDRPSFWYAIVCAYKIRPTSLCVQRYTICATLVNIQTHREKAYIDQLIWIAQSAERKTRRHVNPKLQWLCPFVPTRILLYVCPIFLTRPNPTHCVSDPTLPDQRCRHLPEAYFHLRMHRNRLAAGLCAPQGP